jgi:hypothetical protein
MHVYRVIILIILLSSSPSFADEGMFPISEIQNIGLSEKGLTVAVSDIYNPDGVSLMNAIIKLSGCTASFVSANGLILTNHHCAFGAVQRASTVENDYLTNGFLANEYNQEIPASGYTASILETYRDVSADVLSAVTDDMEVVERSKAIEKRIKELEIQAEKENPGKRAEVSEMFIGRSYLLFIYTRLKDIRMVYIPPISIGEFGGENDNWIWPRHTGDFSFFRAYVAPDGKPAEYSKENVPYKPIKHFQVAPEGVNEDDFVFIMGYPGRTYRHRTSYYMEYEQNVRMPYLANSYDHAISVMQNYSNQDPDAAIRLASPIKGLSNRMKNYRGKLTGMSRLGLVERKRDEETQLVKYIEEDDLRRKKYGSIFNDIQQLYIEKKQSAKRNLLLEYLWKISSPLKNAYTSYKIAESLDQPDIERESAYMNRNIERTKRRLFLGIKSYYKPSEYELLYEWFEEALALPDQLQIKNLKELFRSQTIDQYIDNLYDNSKFTDSNFLKNALSMTFEKILQITDPAIDLIKAIAPELKEELENKRKFDGALNKLHAKLIVVKKEYYNKDFIPDANSTFRLTYGYIRGYRPRDAIYCSPITTFRGVIEKTTNKKPYKTPSKLIDIYDKKDFGQFYNKKLKDVPVALLYNTDTTGGNSGSPVLNSRGQLIGVNFDRAWEATINDYAWNETYSRSIAVDIRYVLWVTQKLGGADYLLKEMNVPLDAAHSSSEGE